MKPHPPPPSRSELARGRGTLAGQRVFFKRRGLHVPRGYWSFRRDEPAVRELLSLKHTPRF